MGDCYCIKCKPGFPIGTIPFYIKCKDEPSYVNEASRKVQSKIGDYVIGAIMMFQHLVEYRVKRTDEAKLNEILTEYDLEYYKTYNTIYKDMVCVSYYYPCENQKK